MAMLTSKKNIFSSIIILIILLGMVAMPNHAAQALSAGDITVFWSTPYATLDSNKPGVEGPQAMYIELGFPIRLVAQVR